MTFALPYLYGAKHAITIPFNCGSLEGMKGLSKIMENTSGGVASFVCNSLNVVDEQCTSKLCSDTLSRPLQVT